MDEETERERHLHAMYDAWWTLEEEANMTTPRFAQPARAILRGQLEAAMYAPYLIYLKGETDTSRRHAA